MGAVSVELGFRGRLTQLGLFHWADLRTVEFEIYVTLNLEISLIFFLEMLGNLKVL